MRFEIGQHCRQIAAFVEDGAGGLAQVHAQFGGDDVRHRRFAQPWWAKEQDVIQRFLPHQRCLDEDFHLRFQRALSDVFGEAFRAHGALNGLFVIAEAVAVNEAVGFNHVLNLSCRARRMRVSVSASSSPTRSMSCAASAGL